jgi:hypothetical protein
MTNIIPFPFRARERWLTGTALAAAGGVLFSLNFAGLGAGGLVFLAVIAGTVLFVVIGGCHRAFYTGVFTGVMYAGIVVWMFIDKLFFYNESLSIVDLLVPIGPFLVYVLWPIAFAWSVTRAIRWLERGRRQDDDVVQ